MSNRARAANAPAVWDNLWSEAESTEWRADTMAPVYDRIAELMKPGSHVVDIGGGVGMLAEKLRDEKSCDVEVWEHNATAIAACLAKKLRARKVDIESATALHFDACSSFVATEVLEHLTDEALDIVLRLAKNSGAPCFFSVPNDRLGPDEEPQHARSWTALEFLTLLRRHWPDARVEVLGLPWRNPHFPKARGQASFLLGVVGMGARQERVSLCFPARDEAADIEKCLASYRGFVDEMVIGIDPRTKDATRELAAKYAEHVFELTELRGPADDLAPEGGFHFAHARNQCMSRCTMPWIFMTEAHEPIVEGADALLHLHQVEPYVQVAHVVRQGGHAPYREQWLFPWLCRNRPDIRYERSTHNSLNYGDLPWVILPQVKTMHERVHERTSARAAQRKVQNRLKLLEDWVRDGNVWSLSYLGSEWREHSGEKAVQYLREYMNVGKFSVLRYHTRLVLAKELVKLGRIDEAQDVLHAATGDDWTRCEHWIQLGDLAFEAEKYPQALTFYEYAAVKRGKAPLTTWWVDLAMYSWIPAQRLAMVHAELGNLDEATTWAKHVLADFENFGEDEALAPMITEAKNNISILEDAINARAERAA